jgi:hypothetical protein
MNNDVVLSVLWSVVVLWCGVNCNVQGRSTAKMKQQVADLTQVTAATTDNNVNEVGREYTTVKYGSNSKVWFHWE